MSSQAGVMSLPDILRMTRIALKRRISDSMGH